jgi:hypothetical protein
MVRPHKGDFTAMKHVLAAPNTRTQFRKLWQSVLVALFTEDVAGLKRLAGKNLSLRIGGSGAVAAGAPRFIDQSRR